MNPPGLDQQNGSAQPLKTAHAVDAQVAPIQLVSKSDSRESVMQSLKEVADIAQKVVAVAAILAAGWWFFRGEEYAARVNVEMTAQHIRVSKDWVLVPVFVKVQNVGKRPVTVGKGFVRIQQVLPLDGIAKLIEQGKSPIEKDTAVVAWPKLGTDANIGGMKLQPGEKDSFALEFFVHSSVRWIRIYGLLSEDSAAVTDYKADGWAWTEAQFYEVPLTGDK